MNEQPNLQIGDTFVHDGSIWRCFAAPKRGEYWPEEQYRIYRYVTQGQNWSKWGAEGISGGRFYGRHDEVQFAVWVSDLPKYDPEFPEDELPVD